MTRTVRVYGWDDGWGVDTFSDDWSRLVWDGLYPEEPLRFCLFGPRKQDRWFVARMDPASSVMSPWSSGSDGWYPSEVPKDEARKKLLGFLLDLEVERPERGFRASLVQQFSSGGDSPVEPHLPCPRWVDEDRWRGRYEEARKYVIRRTDTGNAEMEEDGDNPYLGLVQEMEFCSPDFPHPEATAYEKKRWHAMGVHWTITGSTLDELVDHLLELLLISSASSRPSWEAEHVIRGSWVTPSEDEVEVFRMLGEQLPWLWPLDRLTAWLRERP